MKRTVPALFLFLTLAAALLLAACNRTPPPPVPEETAETTGVPDTTGTPGTEAPEVKSVILSHTSVELTVGQKTKVTASFRPEGATLYTDLTWESMDERIATVNQYGTITAVSEGITPISATTANGKTAFVQVTVKAKQAAATTKAPVTTKAPALTTRAPETTAPETTAFVPPEPVADFEPVFPTMPEELADLLYPGEDGYTHIKGADNLRLPSQGEYLVYDRYLKDLYLSENGYKKDENTTAYFVSRELVMTAEKSTGPAIPGVSSAHSYTLEKGLLTVSYNGGESVCRIPLRLFALESGEAADLSGDDVVCLDYYISEAVSVFTLKREPMPPSRDNYAPTGYFLTVFDKGETVTIAPRTYAHNQICFNTKREGFSLSTVGCAAGMRYRTTGRSDDGGASFYPCPTGNYISTLNDYDQGATLYPFWIYYPRKPVSLIAYGDDVYLTGSWSVSKDYFDEKFAGFRIHNITLTDGYAGGMMLYRTRDCLPYFDGDIGVFALRTEFISDGRVGRDDPGETVTLYHYYISPDRGETWIPYSPAPEGEPTFRSAIYGDRSLIGR
ncbi:MAG: Ig domain-containing protein [Clostridia bacterium]|nr:Ig domain-containing protein [Clostridia bacterium]